MIRATALIAMAGGFLFISPSLRQTVAEAGLGSLAFLNDHGPYSYFAAGALALGALFFAARSALSPR